MSAQYDVYVIGNALLDCQYEIDDATLNQLNIQKGCRTLVEYDALCRLRKTLDALPHNGDEPGGSGANSLTAVHHLGGKAYFTCKVVDDAEGHHYLEALSQMGAVCHTQPLPNQDQHTGHCLVLVTPDAERTMLTMLGVSAKFEKNDIDLEALKTSQYLFLEGYLAPSKYSCPVAIEAKKQAEQHGIKTAISLSDPYMAEHFRDELKTMMAGPKFDIAFSNADEALAFTNTQTIDAAKVALSKYAHRWVITLGADGAISFDGEREWFTPAEPVKAIDTLGAGDNYTGAFLYGLTHGLSWQKSATLASRVAGLIVSKYGPRITPAEAQQALAAIR